MTITTTRRDAVLEAAIAFITADRELAATGSCEQSECDECLREHPASRESDNRCPAADRYDAALDALREAVAGYTQIPDERPLAEVSPSGSWIGRDQ